MKNLALAVVKIAPSHTQNVVHESIKQSLFEKDYHVYTPEN